jgi:aspartyl-tRNA(Asn)/glutamyl-tRNA(Gln) amidotransferase subunit A
MTAVEQIARVNDRIARYDGELGAFIDVLEKRSGREAAESDAETQSGRSRGPLHGMPIGVKELFDVEGADNSYGSESRRGLIGERDALVVERLRAAGAVIAGTTRSHEFGWGITTQHATRGSTRNPWNLERVPGGSSGGSAAAVAAGILDLAVGTDTGGSIRLPAAFCGVMGLKTTFGRVPRTGVVPLAPSFDSVGFLARSAPVLAAALSATAGSDENDPSTIGAMAFDADPLEIAQVRRVRFAVPDGFAPALIDPDREAALETISDGLRALGARRVDAVVPPAEELYELFTPIQLAEALDVHSRVLGSFPSRASQYGADVRGRLERAGSVSIGDYLAAKQAAGLATAALHRALETAEVLVSIVGGSGPSDVRTPDEVEVGGRTITLREAAMPSTVPQNLAGLPSVTVPVGVDAAGMPIGVQLTGARWTEHMLLTVAWALERAGAVTSAVAPAYRGG